MISSFYILFLEVFAAAAPKKPYSVINIFIKREEK